MSSHSSYNSKDALTAVSITPSVNIKTIDPDYKNPDGFSYYVKSIVVFGIPLADDSSSYPSTPIVYVEADGHSVHDNLVTLSGSPNGFPVIVRPQLISGATASSDGGADVTCTAEERYDTPMSFFYTSAQKTDVTFKVRGSDGSLLTYVSAAMTLVAVPR